jgi:hypothetical protein
VGADGQHPAIRQDRVFDPEPAAIHQVGFE